MQLQQQQLARQATKGANAKMAAPVKAPASRPVARAPAQKAMGAGLQQVAAAQAQAARRSIVAKAIGNGVSAPGPATPLNVVFVSAEVCRRYAAPGLTADGHCMCPCGKGV